MFTLISITFVFSSFIFIFQKLNKIIYSKENKDFILNLCLVYNNPGSIIIKNYHLTSIPFEKIKEYYHIDISKIKKDKGIDNGHLTLLNISSTINMTEIRIGG